MEEKERSGEKREIREIVKKYVSTRSHLANRGEVCYTGLNSAGDCPREEGRPQAGRGKDAELKMTPRRDSWIKIVWRIFYPLLLYFGMTLVVTLVVAVGMSFVVLMDGSYLAGADSTAQLTLMYNQIMELYNDYGYYLILVGSALFTIPLLLLFFHRDKKKRREFDEEIPYRQATPVEYVLVALVSFGACIGGNGLLGATGLMELDSVYQQTSSALYSAGMGLQVVGLVIVIPICEELIFRGLIYNRLKDYMSANNALWFSALLFGLDHGTMVQFLYAFIKGASMAYIYEKYHSMAAPCIFHMVSNLVSVLITGTAVFDFLYRSRTMMLVSGIVGVLVVIYGIRMIREMVKLDPKDPASKVEL